MRDKTSFPQGEEEFKNAQKGKSPEDAEELIKQCGPA